MIRNASPILGALKSAAVNEEAAVAFLEDQRWGNEPVCPRCGSAFVYRMQSMGGERNKDYRWRCRTCKSMYTVRTGTVLEESRLPIRVWVYAFWKACSSKKGISALQLAREMEITHKSALFVLRRIRHGVGQDEAPKLTGTIELDETSERRWRGRMTYYERHRRSILRQAKRRYRSDPRVKARMIRQNRKARLCERMLDWWIARTDNGVGAGVEPPTFQGER